MINKHRVHINKFLLMFLAKGVLDYKQRQAQNDRNRVSTALRMARNELLQIYVMKHNTLWTLYKIIFRNVKKKNY